MFKFTQLLFLADRSDIMYWARKNCIEPEKNKETPQERDIAINTLLHYRAHCNYAGLSYEATEEKIMITFPWKLSDIFNNLSNQSHCSVCSLQCVLYSWQQNIKRYSQMYMRLPDDVGTGVDVVKCRKKMLIAWPARRGKQHPNMQLRYRHT